MAHAALVTLAFEETLIQHVQLDNAPGHSHTAQAKQRDHQTKTPGIQTAIGLEAEFLHGCTKMTSLGSGTCMPSCSVAIRSMRL